MTERIDEPGILAVDDEQRGVELVGRILRTVARVETATSGEEGWRIFQQGSFDIVISDQRMPGISGVELLGRVADARPFTGRILLTGFAESSDTIEAINRGRVHAYLCKPCPPDQLRHTVRSVIERIGLLRENARLQDVVAGRGSELASRRPARDLPAAPTPTPDDRGASALLAHLAEAIAGEVDAMRASSDALVRVAVGANADDAVERLVLHCERLSELTEALRDVSCKGEVEASRQALRIARRRKSSHSSGGSGLL